MTVRTTVKKHFMPNFELRSVLLFSALVVGVAIATHAQSNPPAALADSTASVQMTTAGAVDVIAPNKITMREIDAAFNRADTNHDGKLSREEVRHFPAIEPRFDQIDTNHDGFISRDEFMKAAGSGS
jgi:hypothetical protein